MSMKGTIEVVCGPMFSGKTEELIKRVHRTGYAKQVAMVFKPAIDNRYSEDCIASHSGAQMPTAVVNTATEIEVAIENHRAMFEGKMPDVVAVEEVQFFDERIVQTLYDLKCQNVRVIVAGLDMDWTGQPFPIVSTLMAIADKVDKQAAVCVVCGEDATHSYLKNKTDNDKIQVGAIEKYEARCFKHWQQ